MWSSCSRLRLALTESKICWAAVNCTGYSIGVDLAYLAAKAFLVNDTEFLWRFS